MADPIITEPSPFTNYNRGVGSKPKFSAKYLRSILDYDPASGNFTWRYRENIPNAINARDAGTKAGTIRNKHNFIVINGIRYASANLAWLWMTGSWPTILIDHKDGNGLNNSWTNLRDTTYSTNTRNSKRPPPSSGFRGVYKRRNRWEVRIGMNGGMKIIGYYDTFEKAKEVRLQAEANLWGEFCPRD